MAKAPTPAGDTRTLTVRLLNGYVPAEPQLKAISHEAQSDVFVKVPAGTVLELPIREAARLVKLGKAEIPVEDFDV
jgi:hypothetical protein